MIEIYDNWLFVKWQVRSDWEVTIDDKGGVNKNKAAFNGKSINDIISFLKTQCKAKMQSRNETCTHEALELEVLESWQIILDSYDKWDKFEQKNTKLNQIASNMQNIVVAIKRVGKQAEITYT